MQVGYHRTDCPVLNGCERYGCGAFKGTPVEMIKDEMQRQKNLVFVKYL
jgi:hypothetical protein